MQRTQTQFDFTRGEQLAMIRDAQLTAPAGAQVSAAALKAALRAIDDHGRGRPAFPALNTIARESGLGLRTVKRAVAALEAMGLLIVQRRNSGGGRQSNRYTVVWSELGLLRPGFVRRGEPAGDDPGSPNPDQTPSAMVSTPSAMVSTPSATMAPPKCHHGPLNVPLSEQEAPSKRLDGDGDEDGGIFSEQDQEEIRRQANHLADLVPCAQRPDNRDLVAKVALLVHQGLLSEDDLQQARESLAIHAPQLERPGAWLFQVLENRIGRGPWLRMLARCNVPDFLKGPTSGQKENAHGGNRASGE